MFRKMENQLYLEEFVLPFEGKLRADNRWVKLAKIIPWQSIEERYANLFPSHRGQKAKPVRMALGALIIKERCGYSDRETVEQITENPYLQFFIGLKEYQDRPPFDPSLMVHFRKRFGTEALEDINEEICLAAKKAEEQKDDDDNKPGPPSGGHNSDESNNPERKTSSFITYPVNQGKLILDATCAPADIRFPTDLSLLNEAREKLDDIIDIVHKNLGKPGKRPRTYRQKARKAFLSIARNKKPGEKALRKAIGKQLRYVRRNLGAVERLLAAAGDGHGLSHKQQETLSTIRILYEQQLHMYTHRTHKINDRIVSISQPHVRPIVRGKATADVEFGAKVAISIVNGYAFVETLSWDAFNEGKTLIESIENYYRRYGCYPEVVQADKIYRNRENLRYCEERGIRLSGPRLGRPSADKEKQKEEKRLERQDASERNAVEGKFGEGKRRYGLARIMARLKETAESEIYLQFLVMNLEHRLRVLLSFFLRHFFQQNLVLGRPHYGVLLKIRTVQQALLKGKGGRVKVQKITLDLSNVLGFVSEQEIARLQEPINIYHKMLHDGTGEGGEFLGWVDLPSSYDREEFARVKSAAEKIRSTCEVFIVVGIGGSYLGSRAAIEMLGHSFYNEMPGDKRGGPKIYFAGHNASPIYLKHLLEVIEGQDICVNVISKSGTTTEPALAFRILKEYVERKYGKAGAAKRIYATTDKSKGALRSLSEQEGYETFVVPDAVGGRYSVLTSVGLLPMAVAGIDIDEVMRGARVAAGDFDVNNLDGNMCYRYAALRNILYRKGKTVEVLVSYEPSLVYLGEWFKQLFGESEGKEGKGIFPASLNFTTDLHSMGQYMQDGRRDLFETVLNIESYHDDIEIKKVEGDMDGLNYLEGKTIGFVNKKAMEGTVEAHVEGGVSNLIINVPAITPYYYGYLVYFFEKACGMSGYLLGVNPFDQPGVEAYKRNMFKLLGK